MGEIGSATMLAAKWSAGVECSPSVNKVESTVALKPRREVNRILKQGYQ